MQLLSLRIENFGLFRGPYSFDLAPTDAARKMTLFVGHNGAGKSTLFRALAVALHGPLALGDRVTHAQYSEFLYNRLHRRKEGEKNTTSDNASVGLSFEYVQSGVPRRVHVSRRWRRSGRTVEETLAVTQDGQALTDGAADAQAWLNELLPPGVARLCFFDAEDLDALAGADQRNPQLGAAMQRLLGLDMIQRLQADLRAYTLREGGDSTINALRGAVLAHQATLEGLERRLPNCGSAGRIWRKKKRYTGRTCRNRNGGWRRRAVCTPHGGHCSKSASGPSRKRFRRRRRRWASWRPTCCRLPSRQICAVVFPPV